MDDSGTYDQRILKRCFLAIIAAFVALLLVVLIGTIRKSRDREELLAALSRFDGYGVSASYEPYHYSPPPLIDSLPYYRGGLQMHAFSISGERPLWADCIAIVFDNDPFAEIYDVEINGRQFSDADVLLLREIPGLRVLDLYLTGITDDGVAVLAEFDKLTVLNLSRTQISDRGLSMLEKLPELRKLGVWDTKITKEALEAFRKRHPDCLVFD